MAKRSSCWVSLPPVVACSLSLTLATALSPYAQNPFYWQYQGKPVLLIGGSVEDNLFQIPELEEHLDLLRSAGGNYVRCTMSSRDEGNVWPFERDAATGLYDLDRPSKQYWSRFQRFLKLTGQREIAVQLEVWATFDFYDGREMRRPYWQQNPFNPKNNRNYDQQTSGLPEKVDSHPTQTRNPFFRTVPAEDNNLVVLPYQQAFVDELLKHSFEHGHILYCMDNETSVTPRWGAYWAGYIRNQAESAGLVVQTTEMWDPWDLSDPMHENTFRHPELYSFIDVSQNNHQKGQSHWDNAQRQRARISQSGRVRPLNNVKIYGADGGRFGEDRDGVERFWRNILGGMSSARFHRPDSGIGLSLLAQANLRSARMITSEFNLFKSEPANDLLQEREDNEAYCTAEPGLSYVVFFPRGGRVLLDTSAVTERALEIRWLNILESGWLPSRVERAGPRIVLEAPSAGYWVVLVQARGG